MEGIRFEIPTKPVPASRPRVTPRGAFYPKAHMTYKEYLKQFLKTVPAFPTSGVVEVRVLFVMPPYKTSDYPTHRADVDNLAKLPLDCMTDSFEDEEKKEHRYWDDDSLVVHLTTMKRFAREGEEPHTKLRIIPINGDVTEHVERMFDA